MLLEILHPERRSYNFHILVAWCELQPVQMGHMGFWRRFSPLLSLNFNIFCSISVEFSKCLQTRNGEPSCASDLVIDKLSHLTANYDVSCLLSVKFTQPVDPEMQGPAFSSILVLHIIESDIWSGY